QLVLPMPVFEREVHQENRNLLEFQFNDQALDAGVAIMESLAAHPRCGEEGIALLAHDGDPVVHGRHAVLALEGGVMADGARDKVRLVEHSGTDGAGIDLDQAHDVRVLLLDEVGDPRQNQPAGAKVTRARYREVERGPGSGGISYIVNQQSHWELLYRRPVFRA